MASIRKRGNAYQVRVSRKGSDSMVKSFASRQEAEQWARAMEHALDLQMTHSQSSTRNISFGDLLEKYLKTVTPHKRGAKDEAWRIRAIRRDPICGIPISELTTRDAAQYRDRRLGIVSSGTVRREFNLLNHVWTIARVEWLLALRISPFKEIKLPKEPEARQRRLTTAEWDSLIAAAGESRSNWLKPLMVIAYETALRRSELLTLTPSDIDFERGYLSVKKSKSGHSRLVPLTVGAVTELRSWLIDLEFNKKREITPSAVNQAFRKVCKRAGVADFHWHDFRHCATSRFAELGLSPVELMAITGHRQLGSLMRYAHVQADHIRRKINV
jgi:integrase